MYNITPSTQAILLLTSSFSEKKSEDIMPLNPVEWGRFALWLHEHDLKPEDLVYGEVEELLSLWVDSQITISRIKALLNRGTALALAMEKWQRVGIWVITRSSLDYPKQLKKKLKHLSPPVLYGIGNPKLLNKPSIAVVGSRKASKEALEYTHRLGHKIANDGYTLVSGGAKGIDEAAMMGALEVGGTVIGILPDNLSKASLSSQYRKALMSNELALISTNYPESPFSAVNALENNKYIYTQSVAAIIAHSEIKGGTWSGANEALKEEYTPLWVTSMSAGNKKLIELGVNIVSDDMFENTIDILCSGNVTSSVDNTNKSLSLFDDMVEKKDSTDETKSDVDINKSNSNDMDSFFDFFMSKLYQEYPKNSIFKPKELEEKFSINLSQINTWIAKAEENKLIQRVEGRIKKYKIL
ncbi:DNA-processing protein DprA [Sulfurovum sp. zt1-1]|uniref:DNA-processing protein DprA n=1 Tax=Sulfurovum zhangzhouensis TaxID=3019067 RepID=A0ABT7QVB6_9BACT|nr:DNA-processing protein DprA [Sulfurovum zhangzhouensis]MDM5270780.1 DNA-processing protein DprA [Sulfurovum zhangzhouensis]